MQESYAYSFEGENLQKKKIHPEIAELGAAILRRDLKWQRKYGVKYFVRRPHHDLNELFEIEQRALQQGQKNLLDPTTVAGVLVIRVATLTNSRIALTQERFDEVLAKGKYPLLPSKTGEGFG